MPDPNPYLKFMSAAPPANPIDAALTPPDPNPYLKYMGASPPANPIDAALTNGQSGASVPASTGSDPFAAYGGHAVSGSNLFNEGMSGTGVTDLSDIWGKPSPQNGQNQSLLKRSWKWLNEPLLSADKIEEFFGGGPATGSDPFAAYGGHAVTSGNLFNEGMSGAGVTDLSDIWGKPKQEQTGGGIMSGIGHGLANLAANLTSPLSILLTLGTLGTGAIEGVGESVLRTAGMEAADVANATKGAKILKDAVGNGHTLDEGFQAVTDAGLDADKLKTALNTLDQAGASHEALTTENLFRRVAGKALQNAGVDADKADTYSKYLAAAIGGGFTTQQLTQAAVAAPRVLDEIRDGDYQKAAELATEALASGALGYAGARSTLREAGNLFPQMEAELGLRAQPTETNKLLAREFGTYDADVTRGTRSAQQFAAQTRSDFDEIVFDPVRLHRIKNLVESGLNADTMAQRFNSLAQSADRNERIPLLDEMLGTGKPEETNVTDTHAIGLAPERLKQLEAEQRVKASYTPKEIDDLLSAYDSRELAPEDYELARRIKQQYDETLTRAQQAGVLKHGIDNYTTNLWEKNNEALTRLKANLQLDGGFAVNTSMARQRAFANSFEGQMLGAKLRPEAMDPIQTAAYNAAQFDKIIAARAALNRIMDRHFTASDGRPILAPTGKGSVLTDADGASVATLVNPNQIRSIRIAQPVIDKLRASGELQQMLDSGHIVEIQPEARADRLQNLLTKEGKVGLTPDETDWVNDVRDMSGNPKPVYAWRPTDYESLNSNVLRDWTYAGTDSAGNPLTILSDLRVHPEAVDYMKRRLGLEESPFRKSAIGRGALAAATELKGLLLGGLSPFHVIQTAGRALQAGVSPIMKLDSWNLDDPVLYKGVQHGLTLPAGADLRAFEDGTLSSHSKIISKIPVIGPLQDSLNTFLFRDFIPSLKAKTFPAVLDRTLKAHPDWTEDKAYSEAASYVNDLYGGQPWKQLGATAASQDFQRIFLLAPDWLRSELNLAARMFRPGQRVAQTDVLRMAAGTWLAARVGNMLLNNGHPHIESPFGVVSNDKEGRTKVYSMRSFPVDLLHMVQDPRNFAMNRLSPLTRAGLETVTGRDEYGRKIPAPALFGNLLASSLPISAQNVGKAIAGQTPDVSGTDQVFKALGGTVYQYKSEAEKLADQLASDRAPSGVEPDPAQIRYRQAIIHLEDQLRAGEIDPSQVFNAVESGDLSAEDAKTIEANFRKTRNLSAPMARLYVRASHLPPADFLRVWNLATPAERADLVPLLIQKRISYFKKLPAAKRDTDPVAAQFKAIYGSLLPE